MLGFVWVLAAGTLIFGAVPFFVSNVVVQSALFSIASALLSVLVGLVVINLFLNSKERKLAAMPLLRLVADLVTEQHNELFIAKGRDTFGMENFNNLVESYARNKHNPEVFSPEELDKLVSMILAMKEDLLKNYVPLEATCRDITYILGWGYDPKILGAILNSRAEILKFIKISKIEEPLNLETKRSLVEQYLDIDGSIGSWMIGLSNKLGVRIL